MKTAFRAGLILASALALSACATYTTAVPEGYRGPTALLKDSSDVYSMSKADIFYALSVNEAEIDNALFTTRRANEGRGSIMAVQKVQRPIPAQPLKIGVSARTTYAAPIMAMANTVYGVKGVVSFTPEAGKVYVVRGKLTEAYSAVWIEEEASKTIVGEKIEAQGSAKLGIFEK
ncbi:hypothetical protein Herbaro_06945 [Herbaspirillum sp. WKF16]|uniref:hypothetical protein n=1 Tax=Herbaspirillum sp. WKF16 TaxID=3028312 RepID=UPI0023A99167|nr:hypothetical protein [Herbaspirillum sp. WKF16]WDZ97522.1 hypothetical protein Herbaro_06945 [Herbaspirillum sp. WKF16]